MSEHAFRYGALARLFHWITVIMVISMVPAGIAMTRISGGSLQNTLFDFHRSVGVVLMVLTLVRLAYRLAKPPEPLPSSIALWQRMAAKAAHAFIYIFLIINPFVGWVATSAYGAAIPVFGLFTMPALLEKDRELSSQLFLIHEVLGIMFVLTIVVHIGAALYHHFVLEDNVLRRML